MYDCIGWISTALALMAYLGVSFNKMDNNSKIFLGMNLLAAIGFFIHAIHISSHSAVIQNIFFGTFSLLGLIPFYINFSWFNIKLLKILIVLSSIGGAIYYSTDSATWLFNVIGWPSVLCIVGSFILYTQKRISTKLYFILNMIGNVTLATHLIYFGNYQFATLQIVCFFSAGYWMLNNYSNSEISQKIS